MNRIWGGDREVEKVDEGERDWRGGKREGGRGKGEERDGGARRIMGVREE